MSRAGAAGGESGLPAMSAGELAVEIAHIDAQIARLWEHAKRTYAEIDRLTAREREAHKLYRTRTKEEKAGQGRLEMEAA